MNTRSLWIALALAACLPGARAAAPLHGKAATDRCEAAVAETVKRMRGKTVKEVQFTASRPVPSTTSDEETAVTGEGRYRAAVGFDVPFNYRCLYNAQTGATSGVLLREADTARAAATPGPAWQPDLTTFSPEPCESATAAALKARHPRVARITFASETRELQPAPNALTRLQGRGTVERAPGMNPLPFAFRCEFEGRSGKVVRVQTDE